MGLEFAAQELNLDPLVGSIATAGISGSIEALLEGQNPLKGAFDTYFNSATGLLTLGRSGATPWERALYLSKINDFSQIIQEQGIGNALETYATSILNRQTIENIWKAGGIYDLLAHNAEIVTNDEGIAVKRLYIDKADKTNSEYIDISLIGDQLLGYKEFVNGTTIITDCVYEVGPDGRVVAKDEKKRIFLADGSREVYIVKDHYLISIEKINSDGKTVVWIRPAEPNHGIEINPDDTIKSGTFYNFRDGWIAEIKNNEASKIIILNLNTLTDAGINNFIRDGITSPYLTSARVVISKSDGSIKVETVPGSTIMINPEGNQATLCLISGNGIANPMPENVPPIYETAYRNVMSTEGMNPNAIYLLPLYENGGVLKDVPSWLADVFLGVFMTQEVISKMDAALSSPFINHDQPITAVLYSGSYNPFMMALGKRPDYNVDTVVALGGPGLIGKLFLGEITNPHVKKIYNIYGSKDRVPFAASNKSFVNFNGVTNIKILGADHFDYFFNAELGIINDKASKFVEQFTRAVAEHDENAVSNLLHKDGVSYDAESHTYTLDISNTSFGRHDESKN